MESTFTSLQAPNACLATSPVLAAQHAPVAAGSAPLCPSSRPRPRLLWLVRSMPPPAHVSRYSSFYPTIICPLGAVGLRSTSCTIPFYVLLCE